ncbi:MAG: hypothetical protein J3Q66DRAFT_363128 [Benniella sp.]|nr:MAG: hypothetical protein J3Q66DRAFT_363128 [Benniella sp.]
MPINVSDASDHGELGATDSKMSMNEIECSMPALRMHADIPAYFDHRHRHEHALNSFYNGPNNRFKRHVWDAKKTKQEEYAKVTDSLLRAVGGSIGAKHKAENHVIIAIGMAKFESTAPTAPPSASSVQSGSKGKRKSPSDGSEPEKSRSTKRQTGASDNNTSMFATRTTPTSIANVGAASIESQTTRSKGKPSARSSRPKQAPQTEPEANAISDLRHRDGKHYSSPWQLAWAIFLLISDKTLLDGRTSTVYDIEKTTALELLNTITLPDFQIASRLVKKQAAIRFAEHAKEKVRENSLARATALIIHAEDELVKDITKRQLPTTNPQEKESVQKRVRTEVPEVSSFFSEPWGSLMKVMHDDDTLSVTCKALYTCIYAHLEDGRAVLQDEKDLLVALSGIINLRATDAKDMFGMRLINDIETSAPKAWSCNFKPTLLTLLALLISGELASDATKEIRILQEQEFSGTSKGVCGRKMDLHLHLYGLELNNSEFKAVGMDIEENKETITEEHSNQHTKFDF